MRTFLHGLLTIFLVVLAGSGAVAAADGPTPYPTEAKAWPGEGAIRVFGWMKTDRARFWRERESKQGTVVLAGDSLFGGWKRAESDLAPLPVANRAIGGDTSRGLLFRFQEDVLDLQPSRIVILVGGNDLSAHQAPDQTARNIERMVSATRAASPTLPIVLCTLAPRDNPKAPVKAGDLDKLNARIRQIAASQSHVTLVDLYPAFASADGGPDFSYFGADRLHLSARGYERLNEVLGPVLKSGNRPHPENPKGATP
jgi:lysophospholipase L1-like esterase